MYNQVIEYVKQYDMLRHKDRIVVGVSGGADSVCLLIILKELEKLYDLELFVVHINHGLRGEEALRDQNHVVALCSQLEVSCHVVNVDVTGYVKKHKCSEEEAGRILRYEAFAKEFEENNCNKIAVAHNKNDIAETVLLNLTRGTGLKGLVGIEPVRNHIIRPLLCVTRDEIEEYLCSRNISYCIDSTNLSDVYSRNKIRHHVIPELSKINEQVVSHIARCARNNSEIEQYLKKQTNELMERIVTKKNGQYSVSVKDLSKADIVLAKRLIREMMFECSGKLKDVDEKHVLSTYSLVEKAVSKQIDLPYGMVAVRDYNEITIKKRNKTKKSSDTVTLEMAVNKPGTYVLSDLGMIVKIGVIDYEKNMIIPKNMCTKWFDYDKIKNTIFLRFRKQGDYLVINSKGNVKTIKSLFIDEKVPREKRDVIPLMCDGSHVMWVLGGRISEAYKITEQSNKVLTVTMMEV